MGHWESCVRQLHTASRDNQRTRLYFNTTFFLTRYNNLQFIQLYRTGPKQHWRPVPVIDVTACVWVPTNSDLCCASTFGFRFPKHCGVSSFCDCRWQFKFWAVTSPDVTHLCTFFLVCMCHWCHSFHQRKTSFWAGVTERIQERFNWLPNIN